MRLARRGGHKAEKKIHVKDIDGHVQSFRAQLAEADLKYQRRPKAKSQPKAGGGAVEVFVPVSQNDTCCASDNAIATVASSANVLPELEGDECTPFQSWRSTVVPSDLDLINFTSMEEGARLLAAIGDTWVNEMDLLPVSPHPTAGVTDVNMEPCTVSYSSEWIKDSSIDVNPSARPLVIDALLSYDVPPADNKAMVERCSEVLTKLVQNGGRHEGQLAATALDSLVCPEKRAGREAANVIWGEKIRCVDF